MTGLLPLLLPLLLSPLLLGVINRVKALFAGRRGQPLLQPYRDLARLLRKGVVYGERTTWVFRLAPLVVLGATLAAVLLLPFGGFASPLRFRFDVVLFAYLMALSRFAIVLGALDTGSSFEGMGASRELLYSSLAEPALFLALLVLVTDSHALSLSAMLGTTPAGMALRHPAATVLVAVTLFVVLLAETARVPFDDPNTHLELTMVHEVMILDHSGPELAAFQYAGALKLWALSVLVAGSLLPAGANNAWLVALGWLAAVFAVAVIIGVIESTMARLRLLRTPQLLIGASLLAVLALLLRLGTPS